MRSQADGTGRQSNETKRTTRAALAALFALVAAPALALEEATIPGESDLGLDTARECLALNIYHEARGEPEIGKLAVGFVVMNRSADGRFPSDVCAVVRQGSDKRLHQCQFSWWCDGRPDDPRETAAWQEALRLAAAIASGAAADPTGGALWYHADYVQPTWQQAFERGPVIGRHVFYRRHPNNPAGWAVVANAAAPQVADASRAAAPAPLA